MEIRRLAPGPFPVPWMGPGRPCYGRAGRAVLPNKPLDFTGGQGASETPVDDIGSAGLHTRPQTRTNKQRNALSLVWVKHDQGERLGLAPCRSRGGDP
jgi:hypothetical protein